MRSQAVPEVVTVDIGNSQTVFGKFRGNKLKKLWKVPTSKLKRQIFLEIVKSKPVVIASVVPEVDKKLRLPDSILLNTSKLLRRIHIANLAGKALPNGLDRLFFDLPFPDQMGADRLANILGAFSYSKPPFLIVDAGTATTFCLVDERSRYIGGAIAPGVEVSADALLGRAAKLKKLRWHLTKARLPKIGKTSQDQVSIGALTGHASMIQGMALRLGGCLKPRVRSQLAVFVTGGWSNVLKLESRFQLRPQLTLEGLRLFHKLI